jgi:hypothetical protein
LEVEEALEDQVQKEIQDNQDHQVLWEKEEFQALKDPVEHLGNLVYQEYLEKTEYQVLLENVGPPANLDHKDYQELRE